MYAMESDSAKRVRRRALLVVTLCFLIGGLARSQVIFDPNRVPNQVPIPANRDQGQATTAASTQVVVAGAVYVNSDGAEVVLTDTRSQKAFALRNLDGTLLLGNLVRTFIPTAGARIDASSFGDFLSVSQEGMVAIGNRRDTAAHRLRVFGGPDWTARHWRGAMQLDNRHAIAWSADNALLNRFGMGAWDGKFHVFRTMSDAGTTDQRAADDLTIDNNGMVSVRTLEILGADVAENFTVRATSDGVADARPGHVVVIDPESPGALAVSDRAYDRRVAGVISGANDLGPGVVLGKELAVGPRRRPVALSGRAYCWADASEGPIEPGDLLTTSSRPGHAMKVTDSVRAQGAVIGKAMTGLQDGRGLVLVLIALQ